MTDWPQRSREDRKGTALDRPGIDGVAHFAAGLVAGMCAKLASHPLDVVKKRYQVAGLQRSLRCGEVGGGVWGGWRGCSGRQGVGSVESVGDVGRWGGSECLKFPTARPDSGLNPTLVHPR